MTKKTRMTIVQPIAEPRAEIAKRMHIAEMYDGFHILEIPGINGATFKVWPGPFQNKRAAALFLETLLDAYAKGGSKSVCCQGVIAQYELEARLLEFLEEQEGIADPHKLAFKLSEYRPWDRSYPDELPF